MRRSGNRHRSPASTIAPLLVVLVELGAFSCFAAYFFVAWALEQHGDILCSYLLRNGAFGGS
jgi:hypothetical protein